VFIFLVIMLGGLFIGVVGIAKIQNYDHPFSFAFIFGVTGFIAGVFFARWVKPYALLSATADYAMATWMFAIGPAGIFILLGHGVNSSLSVTEGCERLVIADRMYNPGKGRVGPTYTLFFNINNRRIAVDCSAQYWASVDHKNSAAVCIYKSKIGFDYIVLKDDLSQ
jgi:hypothetical protein